MELSEKEIKDLMDKEECKKKIKERVYKENIFKIQDIRMHSYLISRGHRPFEVVHNITDGFYSLTYLYLKDEVKVDYFYFIELKKIFDLKKR